MILLPALLRLLKNRAFLFVNLFVLTVFTLTYKIMDMKAHFDVPSTMSNAMYFAISTHTTTGYGDVTPKTTVGRWVAFAHMMTVWLLITVATSWTFDRSTTELFGF